MIVKIQGARKQFSGRTVVDGISLEVAAGELVALIGPSGCGKSTLLRCINGLETVDDGQIQVLQTTLQNPAEIGENNFRQRAQAVRQNVGMVFQSFNLFPHLTVRANVMIAQTVVGKISPEVAAQTADAVLAKVGLSDKADQYPRELSGGQQQRAAIARALAMSPKVMLYDEPTSALDPALVNEVLRVMRQLHQEKMTQIVVTHEMRFAREVADRIVFLQGGQIVEMGSPQQIFSSPRDERTRTFLQDFL